MTLFRSHPDVGQHRQGKVEEHHLHHDGRAADELEVGEGEHVQQAVAVGPHEPGDEADHEATGKPDDGDEYGEPRAAEQSRQRGDQTGRTSWREKEWQYVKIPVVAVALQKTSKYTQ